jgi:lipopolysaccharide/colanic/teichoic acid biosynthesis glycosyltransferase
MSVHHASQPAHWSLGLQACMRRDTDHGAYSWFARRPPEMEGLQRPFEILCLVAAALFLGLTLPILTFVIYRAERKGLGQTDCISVRDAANEPVEPFGPQPGWRRDLDARLRRAFDVLCVGAATLVLAPVIVILMVAIWVESGRPIFFSQARLGQYGQPFRLYKFRKFWPDCEAQGSPLTVEADGRLTTVGRFLAASKLDELPQFWNVLRGDMSLVGPRPESLAFSDCFCNGHERVLQHKPGLFGPCQVMFRHESRLYPTGAPVVDFYRQVLFPAKARIDIDYFSRRTFVSDLGWIIRSAWAIVAGSRVERTAAALNAVAVKPVNGADIHD